MLGQLQALEPIFHGPQYRSAAQLEAIIAPDFWEIGASGRRYSRRFVLETLAARRADTAEAAWQTRDFHCRRLADGLYLLTYTLLQGERCTRRTTLWQRAAPAWKILFHQGTLVAGEPGA